MVTQPASDAAAQVLSSEYSTHVVFADPSNIPVSASGAGEPLLTPENAGVSVSAPRAAGTAPAEIATEIPSIPPTNSVATMDVPATVALDTTHGIPLVMQESLAASSGGMASRRAN
jgi:hypothetical protein